MDKKYQYSHPKQDGSREIMEECDFCGTLHNVTLVHNFLGKRACNSCYRRMNNDINIILLSSDLNQVVTWMERKIKFHTKKKIKIDIIEI